MVNTKRIFLSLTTRCNIKCAKCWRFNVFGAGRDISKEVLDKFMKEFKNYEGTIIVGSGENLISRYIEDYIKWCVDNNIKTTILTTGMMFDKFYNNDYFFKPNITWGVTFDGFSNKEIKNLQLGMDVEKVKRNLVSIRKRYPESSFYINITHMKNNLYSTKDIIKFAHELGIYKVYITQLKLFEGLDDTYTKEQVNDFDSKEFKSVMKEVYDLSEKLGVKLYAPLSSKKMDCFNDDINNISPSIHTNGNIIFCYGRDGHVIGNILDKNGMQVWRNLLNKLKNNKEEQKKWCNLCNAGATSERGYYYIPGNQKR